MNSVSLDVHIMLIWSPLPHSRVTFLMKEQLKLQMLRRCARLDRLEYTIVSFTQSACCNVMTRAEQHVGQHFH